MYGELIAEAEAVMESLSDLIARLERARDAGLKVGNSSLVTDVDIILPALRALAVELYSLVEGLRGGSMFVARSQACRLERRVYGVARSVESSAPPYLVRSIMYVLSLVRGYAARVCSS